jgi:hypothetical protein
MASAIKPNAKACPELNGDGTSAGTGCTITEAVVAHKIMTSGYKQPSVSSADALQPEYIADSKA